MGLGEGLLLVGRLAHQRQYLWAEAVPHPVAGSPLWRATGHPAGGLRRFEIVVVEVISTTEPHTLPPLFDEVDAGIAYPVGAPSSKGLVGIPRRPGYRLGVLWKLALEQTFILVLGVYVFPLGFVVDERVAELDNEVCALERVSSRLCEWFLARDWSASWYFLVGQEISAAAPCSTIAARRRPTCHLDARAADRWREYAGQSRSGLPR